MPVYSSRFNSLNIMHLLALEFHTFSVMDSICSLNPFTLLSNASSHCSVTHPWNMQLQWEPSQRGHNGLNMDFNGSCMEGWHIVQTHKTQQWSGMFEKSFEENRKMHNHVVRSYFYRTFTVLFNNLNVWKGTLVDIATVTSHYLSNLIYMDAFPEGKTSLQISHKHMYFAFCYHFSSQHLVCS